METFLPPLVFICLPDEWLEYSWDPIYSAFEQSGLLAKRVDFYVYRLFQEIEFYHPDALVLLSDWGLSHSEHFPGTLFSNLYAHIPIVSIISDHTWTHNRADWFDALFHPPLHEYDSASSDIEAIVLRSIQVIGANQLEPLVQTQVIKQARALWDNEQAKEAGKVIFERIPRDAVPGWGANVLEVVYPYFPPSPNIDAILDFARNPHKWAVADAGREAKVAAHRIVDHASPGLYEEPTPWEFLIFHLAKDVGKLTYNMYGYPAPFDTSAGWEMAETLKEITNRAKDAALAQRAWDALCDPEVIQLELPWLPYHIFK